MHFAHATPTDAVQEPVASESGRGLFHVVPKAIAFAVSLILLTPAAMAQAQQRVLLVRAGDGVRLDWAEELAGVLRDRWRARGADVEGPPVPTAEEPADISGRLESAWVSYHALRIEEARETLLDVVEDLRRGWGRGLDAAGLGDLWLLLAMAQNALGDEVAARAAIERALTIDPYREIDAARYPPTLLTQVEAARAVPRARGRLVVSVAPEGASVFVDGREVSSAERTLDLPVGTHWVRADAPARASAGAEVVLSEAGESLQLALPIDPALALAELGPLGTPLPSGALEAVSFLGVSPSIFELERRDGEIALLLIDVSSGRRATLSTSPRDALRRSEELLDQLLLDPDDEPLLWPWIVGGSALLVAGAIVLGVLTATAGGGWSATANR